jgi:DNA-binding NarL/FixJ family response regulator
MVEAAESQPITVLVADDHPAIVEIVTITLKSAGHKVVGQARDGQEAVQRIDELRPRVAVLDHRLPQLTGLEVARQVQTLAPETAVVIFTGYSDQTVLTEALDAGVLGFLDKGSPIEDLVRAVEAAAQGEAFIDPLIGGALATTPSQDVKELTQREREVLRLLSEGLTNEQIGQRLYLSGETVRTHVRKAMNKLNASNRVEAVANAMRLGLIA